MLIHKREINYTFVIIAVSLLIRVLCIGSSNLLGEEAYYWNYAAHFDTGYLDHPPMVAALIKIFTTLFGTNELGVRFASILCWLGAALFSFKLTRLIKPGAEWYAVLLLAILPFFFLHSLVITPDLPLIVCWSAALYYLYRALILDQVTSWYIAGIWLGLGMLSKYSIVLLGLATLVYLITVPSARKWFLRKEPYLCLTITALLFTPVIYWNATHAWASFAFQSTRRLQEGFSFSFHQLLGLFVLFLTPLGVMGFWAIFKTSTLFDKNVRYFLQIFTLAPLAVFSLFSLTHEIKFNWIGPALLGIIPWLAILISNAKPALMKGWLITSFILLLVYSSMLFCIIFGIPRGLNQELFSKYIEWDNLAREVNAIAQNIETDTKVPPLIVPMDYNLGSELAFYQAKLLNQKKISKVYPIIGNHIFGHQSLMYQYWSKDTPTAGKILLMVTESSNELEAPEVTMRTIAKSKTKSLWSHGQGYGGHIRKYYYKVLQMKG